MIWLKSVYGSRPSAMRVSFSRPMPRSRERWMLIAARSIVAGGSDRKFRRSSMMRESSACDGSAPRCRNWPSAPLCSMKFAAGWKNTSLRSCSGPTTWPNSSRFSVSPETMECPKRKAAPANSSVMRGSTLNRSRYRRDRVGAEQAHQEFRIGDVRDLGRDDGAGLLVELVAGPVRIEGLAAGRPDSCARAGTAFAARSARGSRPRADRPRRTCRPRSAGCARPISSDGRRGPQARGNGVGETVDHGRVEPAGRGVGGGGRICASVPVVGSITARVIGMNEPSAKTGSPFGTVMVIESTPSLRVSVRS